MEGGEPDDKSRPTDWLALPWRCACVSVYHRHSQQWKFVCSAAPLLRRRIPGLGCLTFATLPTEYSWLHASAKTSKTSTFSLSHSRFLQQRAEDVCSRGLEWWGKKGHRIPFQSHPAPSPKFASLGRGVTRVMSSPETCQANFFLSGIRHTNESDGRRPRVSPMLSRALIPY